MSDSSSEKEALRPAEPADDASTRGWAPPSPADEAAGATQVRPAASTPGPQAPDRTTHSVSTANGQEQLNSLPRLPPIPGYEVRRYVGRGGMGIVYEAVQKSTGRTVALKLVLPGGVNDRVTRERFAREVHALAALKHQNIVPIYEAGDWHGFPYCAMEFVPGGTLAQHLDRIRSDLRGAVSLVAKVARAVSAMHAAGVLHRDLKPLNILLGEHDEPMVADFGLARWAGDDSDLTRSGLPIGTRHYMSPEQTLGQRCDYTTACDVWALGVTLYEVLTGERPFSDDAGGDVYSRIRTDEPPPIASLAPAVPADLEAIALRCLAKKPEERYATASAVADDLERWLRGEPVLAAMSSALTVLDQHHQAQKKARRTRVLLAGIGVVLIAAGVGALIALRPWRPVEPVKTLAQRVAAGEKVKLTDEKGVPTVAWTQTEGYGVMTKGMSGYQAFSTRVDGIVALADEKWRLPIRVEAEVAVLYETKDSLGGGVYVGRKEWQASDRKHGSFVWFSVRPEHSKKPVLRATPGVYWWEGNHAGSYNLGTEARFDWNPGDKREGPRFARLDIEVREDGVRGKIDGGELDTVTENWALNTLRQIVSRERPMFPEFTFDPPAFGGGIGIFLSNADCTVVNLSVSRLDP